MCRPRLRVSAEDFWSLADRSGGPDACWTWTGTIQKHGYGYFHNDTSHRAAYRFAHGSIPEGAWICHHCDNPSCVNPRHLYAGTASTNAQDRENRGRRDRTRTPLATCKRGHDFTDVEIIGGYRRCRPCHREAKRRYKARLRLANAA